MKQFLNNISKFLRQSLTHFGARVFGTHRLTDTDESHQGSGIKGRFLCRCPFRFPLVFKYFQLSLWVIDKGTQFT